MLPAQNSKLKVQNHNSKLKTEVKFRAYHFSLAIIKFVSQFPNQRLYFCWLHSGEALWSQDADRLQNGSTASLRPAFAEATAELCSDYGASKR